MSKVVDVVFNSNDALGTTIGSKSNGKYSAAVLSAFGENRAASEPRATNHEPRTFFTGKPLVEGLGHAFLMRNYRAGLAKWQTTDPMGYPDGWNQLAYCNNGVALNVDVFGAKTAKGGTSWNEHEVQEIVGTALGWTISHQVYIVQTKLVSDRFDVTIPYEGLDNGGVADIAVGQITGKWSLYNTLDDPDRDGMATSVGWSILFINVGRTYFANYGAPEVWRSEDKRSVKYTYTFAVYTCEYVGADIPLPKGSIGTGWQTDLPGLDKLGSFKVTLSHSIKE